MSLSDNYRQLAALIEALESHGVTVQQAMPVADDARESPADQFVVRLEVGLPEDGTVPTLTRSLGAESDDQRTDAASNEPADSTATTEALETTDESPTVAESAESDDESRPSEPPAEATEAAEAMEATETPEATEATASTSDDHESAAPVVCTVTDCDRTFETERGMKIHRTKAHPLSDAVERAGDGGMHYDPEALRRVYRNHETFAEMTAALDVDVGAQAVRKQMIRHGIHQPGDGDSKPAPNDEIEDDGAADHDAHPPRPDTTSDGSDEERDSTADDGDEPEVDEPLPPLDLPGDLTVEELKAAVEAANTHYDVQRALELDHDTTHEILCEYDLLDLVTGRASTARQREEQKAELTDRLQRAAT